MKKTNKGLLIALMLFIASWTVLGPVYLFTAVIGFDALHSFFDNKSVFFPEYIGKEMHLAPFALVTKMTNYGAWRDEYNYIFANKVELENVPRLNEYTTFKVIDEKTQSALFNPTTRICILENQKNKNQIVSIECDDIPRINEVTKVYRDLATEIQTKGKVFVATTADRHDSKLKRVLKINTFIVYEIFNESELKELVAPNDKQNESYDFLMHSTHLIHLKPEEVFDEAAQSKIFIHYFGGHWNEEFFGHVDFEKYVEINKTTPDMEKWLMENHSDPRVRWAIRSILSIVQQAINLGNKIEIRQAAEFVKGLEESKECVASYYSLPGVGTTAIDIALEKFLEKPERKSAFAKIKFKSIFDTGPNSMPCHTFLPPVICDEEGKCEKGRR